jgi:hypothetical protein
MMNSSRRDIVGTSQPGAGPRHVAVTDATRFHDWLCEEHGGLYKLEDSSGKAVMFDHGGEEVTRVVF